MKKIGDFLFFILIIFVIIVGATVFVVCFKNFVYYAGEVIDYIDVLVSPLMPPHSTMYF